MISSQIQSIHQRLGWSLSEQLWKTRDRPLHLGLPQILVKTRLAHMVPFAHWRGPTSAFRESRSWSPALLDFDPGDTAMP